MKSFQEELDKIRRTCDSDDYKNEIEHTRMRLLHKPIILYGAGVLGDSVLRLLKHRGLNVSCFCDKNKTGIHTKSGLPIITPIMLIENYKDANVIICSSKYADEIKCDLNALGIKDNQIFTRAFLNLHDMDFSDIEPHITGYERAFNLFDDDVSKEVIVGRIKRLLFSLPIVASPQPSLYYFDPGVIDLSENEIFVDGGMYIGDTAELFFNRVEKKYRHYYGFEPDKDNYYEASKNLAGKDNVTLINKGLWSSETHLSFSAGLATNSKLEVGGTSFVNVTALDVYFSNTRSLPTLIKMDIEGAEYEALLGAGHIICEQKPRLAICAYHKTEDIYVLPDLIKSYREDYKYYLRHYSSGIYGTVLYAV